jgi:hypothetical protein
MECYIQRVSRDFLAAFSLFCAASNRHYSGRLLVYAWNCALCRINNKNAVNL